MNLKNSPLFFLFACLILSTFTYISCNNSKAKEGEVLAKTYCASCHLQPLPGDLPKNVWQYSTLPYMGMMMGLDKEVENLPEILKTYTILKAPQPLISQEDFEKIKEYYLSNASESKDYANMNFPKLEVNNQLFTAEDINLPSNNQTFPNFTCVKFDPGSKRILAGDQSNRVVWILNANGTLIKKLENQDALTYVEAKGNQYLFTYIGSTTQANPNTEGHVDLLNAQYQSKNILNKVKRPLEGLEANLDADASNELITCEFGFNEGGLAIWKKGKSGYEKHLIDSQTGCTSIQVKDFNKDGKLDILALFAQGNERINLFINKGNLTFESKTLLRFNPIWGSSSFDLVDVNQDGQLDIVTTSGDNADFTTVLKPFHGIRIYENKGDFQFREPIFIPQNGATKVMHADFDVDGDQDLLSISLFPNVTQNPQEQILFIENRKGQWVPQGIPAFDHGRYAVMDLGDIDNDGDVDVLLGSHAVAKFPEGQFNPNWKNAKGLTILRNSTK